MNSANNIGAAAAQEVLEAHRKIWKGKPVLRAVYEDYYRRISEACVPGRTLEVGGGTGNLREFRGDIVSSDIVTVPWLDVVADAQRLPFASESFANIVAVDVLHHIHRPLYFLAEVERVLQPAGRLVLVEPAITPLSWPFYRFFHPEPVVLHVDPLEDGIIDSRKDPFEANQAIPTLLFGPARQRLRAMFPALSLWDKRYLSVFVYPLSGGFRNWCLVPSVGVGLLLRLDAVLSRVFGRVAGFRLFVVIEKLGALNGRGIER